MLFSVTVNATPTPVAQIPSGTRKVIISNPPVNAAPVSLKLDYSATVLTFANGIQLPAGGTLVLDLLPGPEISMQVVGIAAAAAQVNVQTL